MERLDDASKICISCGMCCDGTLIGFVMLNEPEVPQLREVMEIEESHGNGFILNPCEKLCNGCSIYSQRPQQCRTFKCKLLNSVENRALTLENAIVQVIQLKELREKMEQQLKSFKASLMSKSFYFKMVELKKFLSRNEDDLKHSKEFTDLISQLKELDQFMSSHFGISID